MSASAPRWAVEVCSRFWSAVRRGRGGAARNAFTHASSGSVSDMAGGGGEQGGGKNVLVWDTRTVYGVVNIYLTTMTQHVIYLPLNLGHYYPAIHLFNLHHHIAVHLAMKVFSISLLSVAQSAPPAATLLGTAQDLSSFSFYQRSSVGEFMTFFTKVSLRFVPSSSAIHSRATTTDRRRANPCEPAVVRRGEQLQSPCLCHFRPNTRWPWSCRYVPLV